SDLVNAADWDGLLSALDDDIVALDHRGAGNEARGRPAAKERTRALVASADRFETRLTDVLALTADATLWRWDATGEVNGGSFDMPSYIVSHLGPTGQFDRMEFFDADHLADAWTCFHRFNGDRERRRMLPNAASRVVDEWIDALRAGDAARAQAYRSLDFKYVDHELHVTLDLAEQTRRQGSRVPTAVRHELLATMGERHVLHRFGVEHLPDDRPSASFDLLLVSRVEGDHIRKTDAFPADKLARALSCLVERWSEDEEPTFAGAAGLARSCLLSDVVSEFDRDSLGALLATACVVEDHRPTSAGTLAGREEITAWVEQLVEVTKSFRASIADILAFSPTASLWVYDAHGQLDGAPYELPSLLLLRFDDDGLIERGAFFPIDELDAAWARFDELDRPPVATRRITPNVATAAAERWAAAVRGTDPDAVADMHAPGYAVEHHDLRISIEQDDNWKREINLVGNAKIDTEVLATLGDRHALRRLRMELTDEIAHGGVVVVEMFDVCRASRDGLLLRDDTFELAQLDLAIGCLVERWAEDELTGTARSRGLRHARAWGMSQAINARDWDEYRDIVSDDVVLVDHRPAGTTVRGRDDVTAWSKEIVDLVEGIRTDVLDVLALTADAALMRWQACGGTATAPVVFPSLLLWHIDPDGHIDRFEFFATDEVDHAWARFDAVQETVRRRIHPNIATAGVESWLRAARTGDRQRLDAQYAPDYVMRYHGTRVDFDEGASRANEEAYVGHGTIDLEAIASLGRCHALFHIRLAFEHDGVGVEYDTLAIDRMADDGRTLRTDVFDVSQLGPAMACLVERWAEHELDGPERTAAMHMAQSWRRAEMMNARDWDGLGDLYAHDFVAVEHQVGGFEIRGRAAMVAWTRNLVESAEHLDARFTDVYAVRPDAALVRWDVSGVHGGGPVDSPRVIAARFGVDGRMTRFDVFDIDEIDAAWACFDGIETTPANAHRMRSNLASAAIARRESAIGAGDAGAALGLQAPEYVLEQHEHHITIAREANRASVLDLVGRSAVGLELLTTLGERHALHHLRIGVPDRTSGGEVDYEMYLVSRARADGLITRDDAFEPARLGDARACLVQRWAEDELHEGNAAVRSARIWAASICVGDRSILDRQYASGFVMRQHDLDVELSLASQLDADRMLLDGQTTMTIDPIDEAGDLRALLRLDVVLELPGLDAGPLETDWLIVYTIDRDGRCVSIDSFREQQLDAARACLHTPANDVAPNAATRPFTDDVGFPDVAVVVIDRMTKAHNDRDAKSFRACFADDAVIRNHKPAGFGATDADGFLELTESLWSLHHGDVTGTVIRSTNDRLLAHSVTNGEDNNGGLMQISSWVTFRLVDGHVHTMDIFDFEERAAAEALFGNSM
ncbi:MAG: hypothetical protein QOD30_2420, partial [Actinomycetota bacterium]|nr:hypothetical protein [Actinomycetota bacterium]